VSDSAAPEAAPRGVRRVARWLVVGLLLACLVVVARTLDRRALLRSLASANLALVALAAVLNFVHLAWKSIYWRVMLQPTQRVPLGRLFRYTLLATTMSAVAPARAGDFARIWLLRRHHGVSLRTLGAILAYEKLADVAALLVLVAPVPWLLPAMPHQVSIALRVLSAVASLCVLAVVGVRVSPRLRAWVRTPRGMEGAMLRALLPNALSWLTDLVEIGIVAEAVGIHASWSTCALVILGVNFVVSLPAPPGNVGTLELGAIAALALVGVPTEQATTFALLYHVMQLVPVIVVGLVLGRTVAPPASKPAWTERASARHGDVVRQTAPSARSVAR
jgi:hypothetical protein